jgi:hydroxymethylglutaryl-CoA lyase
MSQQFYITECPRDAMQGIQTIIPTATKIKYLNQLLKVGFDVLDFGSFVSPKAIPQMADTEEVLAGLDLRETKTKLLAIVANEKGAARAVVYDEIQILGFPLSVSEIFQQKNTNKNIDQALHVLENIAEMCQDNFKTLLVYLSMAFGNPYGEPYDPDVLTYFVEKLQQLGVKDIALADTVGTSSPFQLEETFSILIKRFPEVHFSAHLHARPDHVADKVNAAWKGGCRRFDTAIKGFGGCPMAMDELVGNVDTELFLNALSLKNIPNHLDMAALGRAINASAEVFAVGV